MKNKFVRSIVLVLLILSISIPAMVLPVYGEDTSGGTANVVGSAPVISSPAFTDTSAVNKDGVQIDVNTEYWVSYTIADANTLVDLNTVTFVVWGPSSTLEGSDAEADHYTFTYTQATDAWTEVGPDAGDSHLVSGSCTDPGTQTDGSGTFRLAFKLGKIAEYTATALWTITTTVIDDDSQEDTDATLSFGATFYSEVVTTDATHAWSGLVAGDTEEVVDGDGVIDITVTANAAFDVMAQADGPLISGTDEIALENLLIHLDTLGSAIALTESYADIIGMTSEAAGADLAKTFTLWLTIPNPQAAGAYTYTLSVQAEQS